MLFRSSRYPRVSFRVELPFLIGIVCTYGLWTKLHHSAYSKRTLDFPCLPLTV